MKSHMDLLAAELVILNLKCPRLYNLSFNLENLSQVTTPAAIVRKIPSMHYLCKYDELVDVIFRRLWQKSPLLFLELICRDVDYFPLC